jgi:hypothetical protein
MIKSEIICRQAGGDGQSVGSCECAQALPHNRMDSCDSAASDSISCKRHLACRAHKRAHAELARRES